MRCHSFAIPLPTARQVELRSRSSHSLKKVSERLQHLAFPNASLAVPSATQVADLSRNEICVDEDLHEVVHDLVDARSPLQTMSEVK